MTAEINFNTETAFTVRTRLHPNKLGFIVDTRLGSERTFSPRAHEGSARVFDVECGGKWEGLYIIVERRVLAGNFVACAEARFVRTADGLRKKHVNTLLAAVENPDAYPTREGSRTAPVHNAWMYVRESNK